MARLDGSRLMVRQLAHEIKNPLGGLRGAAQLLERELHDGALKEYTQLIINEADRLRALVDTMFGPTRAPAKTAVNMHELCEHVFHLLRAESRAGDHDRSRLRPEPAERDVRPEPDDPGAAERRAQRAAGAGGPGPHHAAHARAQQREHRHGASSPGRQRAGRGQRPRGPGAPALLVFYPLVTRRSNGTGLGLAVAQDLVTRNGGIVEFESEPGHTVFSLLLPLGEDP